MLGHCRRTTCQGQLCNFLGTVCFSGRVSPPHCLRFAMVEPERNDCVVRDQDWRLPCRQTRGSAAKVGHSGTTRSRSPSSCTSTANPRSGACSPVTKRMCCCPMWYCLASGYRVLDCPALESATSDCRRRIPRRRIPGRRIARGGDAEVLHGFGIDDRDQLPILSLGEPVAVLLSVGVVATRVMNIWTMWLSSTSRGMSPNEL